MREKNSSKICTVPLKKKYFYPARARSAWARRACALRAESELRNGKSKNGFQDGKLTVMPRAKIGSSTKIGGVWQKLDFWTKNQNFGLKKRHPLFYSNHVPWPRPEKVVQRKKVPLPK